MPKRFKEYNDEGLLAGYIDIENCRSFTIENDRYMPELRKWIAQGNTPDPANVPPVPTYQELRRARYKAESDPLYTEAVTQSQYDGTAPDLTLFNAKVLQIKTDIPKKVV